jgi:hypothetical protein
MADTLELDLGGRGLAELPEDVGANAHRAEESPTIDAMRCDRLTRAFAMFQCRTGACAS